MTRSRKPAQIRSMQEKNFAALLRQVLRSNRFYQEKYQPLSFTSERPIGLSDLGELPFTLKSELVRDQQAHPPFGSNLTFPLSRYTRLHYTSGTVGNSLRWLDTAESWRWWIDCWKELYQAAGITAHDHILVACPFGPFISFWTAFEAGQQLGALMTPGGGLSSLEQLEMMVSTQATVLVSTANHALRLSGTARQGGYDLAKSSVRVTIHSGEPSGSIPDLKSKIQTAWNANCFDIALATEIGAWGFGCGQPNHLHINEAEFIVEVIDPQTRQPVSANDEGILCGEMVLTNLGRVGSPLIRYCTRNLVEFSRQPCPCGRNTAVLKNGVLDLLDGCASPEAPALRSAETRCAAGG